MANWILWTQKSVEKILTVLINRCRWVCFVISESFLENLICCFTNEIFYLPQLLFLFLDLPLLCVLEARFKAFVTFVARSCLSLFNSLLALVVLALFERLPVHCVVVLFGPYIFPLLDFFDAVEFRLGVRSYAEKVRVLWPSFDLFVHHFKFSLNTQKHPHVILATITRSPKYFKKSCTDMPIFTFILPPLNQK